MRPARSRSAGAFVLLEALLAVAIFATGIIALGRCVTNCVAAEQFKAEDARARRALESRLVEIESGAVPIINPQIETLSGAYSGLKLKQTATPLRRKNESGVELSGLFSVTLEVTWSGRGEAHSRASTTYVLPRES
jgi:hypothetical protein